MQCSYRYKTDFGILLIIQVSEQKFHMRVQVLDAMLVRVASQDPIEPFSLSRDQHSSSTISYKIPVIITFPRHISPTQRCN